MTVCLHSSEVTMQGGTALILEATVLVTACPGDGGDADTQDSVGACLASSNLAPPICRCSARKASEELSFEAFAFLVATLQGDDRRTEELRGQLETAEAMEAGTVTVQVPADCAAELGGG